MFYALDTPTDIVGYCVGSQILSETKIQGKVNRPTRFALLRVVCFATFLAMTDIRWRRLQLKPDSKAIGHAMTACNKARKWDETLALYAYANKMGIDR